MGVVDPVHFKRDHLSGWVSRLSKLIHHLREHIVVQLGEELELVRGDMLARWCEGQLNLHDVAQAAESTLIPQLVLVVLFLEPVLEGHCARVAVFEFLVDAHPTH